MARRIKDPDYVCPEEHAHEASSVCYHHHKCRCQWCASEARARYQERKGSNGKWLAHEIIAEIDHMVSLKQSVYVILNEMNVNPATAKTIFYKNGRDDLARMLNRQDAKISEKYL